MKNEKKAFTLAEILITLTIIGVIAAITVPALIQRTNKQEYAAALQKAYSTLSQAANMIIAEEGSSKSSCNDCDDGWADSTEHIYNLFKKHLSNVKECSSGTGCMTQTSCKIAGGGSRGAYDDKTWAYKLITADGAQLSFNSASKTCSLNSAHSGNYCAAVFVDVNGSKKTNQPGRDAFWFFINEKGLMPSGCLYNGDECCKDNAGSCAASPKPLCSLS